MCKMLVKVHHSSGLNTGCFELNLSSNNLAAALMVQIDRLSLVCYILKRSLVFLRLNILLICLLSWENRLYCLKPNIRTCPWIVCHTHTHTDTHRHTQRHRHRHRHRHTHRDTGTHRHTQTHTHTHTYLRPGVGRSRHTHTHTLTHTHSPETCGMHPCGAGRSRHTTCSCSALFTSLMEWRDVVATWGLLHRSPASTFSSYFNHLQTQHSNVQLGNGSRFSRRYVLDLC